MDRDLSYRIGEPPSVTLGAFIDDAMVGTMALAVPARIKQRHKGHVVGVYVIPSFRRTGLARALIDDLIARARENGLLVLTLSVTIGNEAAKSLYLRAGFSVYGVEPAGLRVGCDLLDEDLMALRLC